MPILSLVGRRRRDRTRARRLFVEPLEDRSLLTAVITVNTAADANVRDEVLSLREAIEINNRSLLVEDLTDQEVAQVSGAPSDADRDTIRFNIPGSGVRSIRPVSELPHILD